MLSALALLGFLISINSTKIEVSKSYTTKVKAANYMKQSMELLKSTRMVSGIFVDDENDPNEETYEVMMNSIADFQKKATM